MPKAHQFSLLLFDGFSNLCLANAVEPLRAANTISRQPLFEWQFVALSDATVHSSSGLPVQPSPLGDHCGDSLLVMPSYDHLRHDTPACRRSLAAAARRFGMLAGLDTGSWLLAAAGLLNGYKVTCHWDILSDLAEGFAELDVTEDRFVIDRDRATCGGATTTLDLMLELIARQHGTALALEVAALFMYGERDPRGDPRRPLPAHRIVRAAAALMRRNLETKLPIAEIARSLGVSQRTLQSVFRQNGQASPANVYRSIRLAEARRRLELTAAPITEISQRCGYADATAMTRAFKAEFGMPPQALRARCRR
ncbi:helix-turn-helix domain-containing protein [Seohaeicola saemankumensis]|nr:helix-turn-helix domain-containing protein [Seohaeicola saemankumensis]MCA0872918.1 helix-turn-helix domain-containing protein [Seohaeicola saemankumensis]